MLAKELIKILELNPEAEIVVLHTQYNGYEDVTTWESCQVVTDGDTFVLTSSNFYDKQAAIDGLSLLSVSAASVAKSAKSEDLCIYVD